MKIKLIKAKSILVKSKLPGSDYVINPYTGCAFGCSYCYADFMRRFTGHGNEKWGDFVDIKINAPEILKKELELLKRRSINDRKRIVILFGSVTDPYQGVEAKYKITRKCLKVIEESKCDFDISVLTKSHLVTRDIDILKSIKNMSVGLTITTTDDKISRLLEGNAPPASLRLKALKILNKAGISTYVCINPLLPNFTDNETQIRELLDAIKESGNKEIWLEHINLTGNKLKRVKSILQKKFPEKIKYFEKARTNEYKDGLNKLLFKILEDYDFKIGGGGIIDHRRKTIITRNRKNKVLKSGWRLEVGEDG